MSDVPPPATALDETLSVLVAPPVYLGPGPAIVGPAPPAPPPPPYPIPPGLPYPVAPTTGTAA